MCPSREVKIHLFITKEKTITALKYESWQFLKSKLLALYNLFFAFIFAIYIKTNQIILRSDWTCYDASREINKPKLNRLSVQVNHHTLSLDITIYRCVLSGCALCS